MTNLSKQARATHDETREWLTVKEVASQLRVAAATVYALVKSGRLKSHRIGLGRGTIQISSTDVVDYLERVESTTPEVLRSRTTAKLKHIRLVHALLAPRGIADYG